MNQHERLYHASLERYNVGQTIMIPAGNTTRFYDKNIKRGLDWLENDLEEKRPPDRIPRKIALYACDKGEHSLRFLEGETTSVDIYIYEVNLECYHKSPMALLGFIAKKARSKGSYWDIIDEYWNPKHEWGFYEYLGKELTIIGQVSPPDSISVYAASTTFQSDCDKVKELWEIA